MITENTPLVHGHLYKGVSIIFKGSVNPNRVYLECPIHISSWALKVDTYYVSKRDYFYGNMSGNWCWPKSHKNFFVPGIFPMGRSHYRKHKYFFLGPVGKIWLAGWTATMLVQNIFMKTWAETDVGQKVTKTFLGRGFFPWVGCVTGNTNIFFLGPIGKIWLAGWTATMLVQNIKIKLALSYRDKKRSLI